MSGRRSRRTRGEKPEVVPAKSDPEEDDDDEEEQVEETTTTTTTRGRRRRGRSPHGSSSSLSQLSGSKKKTKKQAPPKRGRGRPPKQRPSESSASSVSASDDEEEDANDSGSNQPSDSDNVSNPEESKQQQEEDDAERDTEDDAPKEALTGRRKGGRKQRKKQPAAAAETPHPRYKNSVKLECRHCGKLCFSQGIKVHEKHCMPVYTPRDSKEETKKKDDKSVDSGQSSSDSSDDSSSPPSPVVIVRKTDATDPAKPFVCRNCGKFFTPRGINAHEKRCMPVYTERESMAPDVRMEDDESNEEDGDNDDESMQVDNSEEENEEQEEEENEEEQEEEEEEDNDENEEQEIPAPKPNTRYCKHCGEMVSTRGFMQHERSCAKKAAARKEEMAKGEATKKKKRKSAAATDDDSMEEDASSSKKGKARGEGDTAQEKASKSTKDTPSGRGVPKRRRRNKRKGDDEDEDEDDQSSSADSKGDSSSASPTEKQPKKRGRKPKSTAAADDSSSDEEKPVKKRGRKPKIDVTVNDSLSSATEHPPKKRGRKPKAKTEVSADDSDDGFSQEDLLPISALATKKSTARGRPAISKTEEDKQGLAAVAQKKKGPKTSKLTKAKGKTAPITDFFAPKSANSDSTKAENDEANVDKKEEMTPDVDEIETTDKLSNSKKESMKSTGADEEETEVGKSASLAEKKEVDDKGEESRESSAGVETEPVDKASADDKNGNDSTAEMPRETEENTPSTSSARPTRNRKPTTKAFGAAAAAAKTEIKDDGKEQGKSEIAEQKVDAEVLSKEKDEPKSANESSEDEKSNGLAPSDDDSTKEKKGSIVEAAKSAAAATLAAFSLFAPKPKPVEDIETASKKVEKSAADTDSKMQDDEEARKECKEASAEDTEMADPTESSPVSSDVASTPVDGAKASEGVTKDDEGETFEDAKEAPPSDTEMEDAEDAATATDTIALDQDKADGDIPETATTEQQPKEKQHPVEEESTSNSTTKPTEEAIENSMKENDAEVSSSKEGVMDAPANESSVQTIDATSTDKDEHIDVEKETLQNETTKAVSDNHVDIIPTAKSEKFPAANDETNEKVSLEQEDTSGSAYTESANGEDKVVEMQETSTSLAVINGNGNHGNEMAKSEEETKSETPEVEKSDENDTIQSSQDKKLDTEMPSTAKPESSTSQSSIANEDNVSTKDIDVDVQEPKDVPADLQESPMVVEEDEANGNGEAAVSVGERVEDTEDSSQKSEKIEVEPSSDKVVDAEATAEGVNLESVPRVAENEEQSMPTQDVTETPEHVTESTAQIPTSTSDSIKGEKKTPSVDPVSQLVVEKEATDEQAMGRDTDVSMEDAPEADKSKDETISNSEIRGNADILSQSGENAKNQMPTLTSTPQLENSVDWKETVSIEPKADIEGKDEASKVSEDRSTGTPLDTKNDRKSGEVASDAIAENEPAPVTKKMDIENSEVEEKISTGTTNVVDDKREVSGQDDENPQKSDLVENQEENKARCISSATISATDSKASGEEDSQSADKISTPGITQNEPVSMDTEKEIQVGPSGEVSSEQYDSALLQKTNLVQETPSESDNANENKELAEVEESKTNTKATESPASQSTIKAQESARKDVSAVVESLLTQLESGETKSDVVTTDMEIDEPGNSPLGTEETSDTPEVTEPDSMMAIEEATEVTLEAEDVPPSPKEELKVSWVTVSKAPRQSKVVESTDVFNGYDESKTNRVKMLLYTAGSKVHRGKGFERIFAMYWDAVCLRLSRRLNGNALKRCDEAISLFLKSRKLRKIHNKFVMSIMKRAFKERVPYSEISQHLPLTLQERVKIPLIISSKKPTKPKRKTYHSEFEDDFLQLSSVPHFDSTSPYKERWEFPTDITDEIPKIPDEGPTVPIASSCIPGALVVDPMLRETVEARGMKVTDSAMWLLTVALKEHIKNILNDSIQYQKGLKRGEVFPQAIHYPNVLASNTNKNRKITKGRSSSSSSDNGRKKLINSIDLFAALNMLPSGQPSSIGGSVSRMSLEQTFLSGFNSIPTFDTGIAFKDVQSFVSNTLTEMAKHRKPEEKKPKPSQPKSIESSSSGGQPTKATPQADEAKTPTAQLSSSVRSSEPNAAPMPSLDSPPLMQSMSPGVVQTPVLNSSTPKADGSQLSTEKGQGTNSTPTESSQTIASGGNATEVENPTRKVTAGGNASQTGPQKSGAGRGAKNLAALMARAGDDNGSGPEGDKSTSEPEKQNAEQAQPSANPTNPVTKPPNNGDSTKPGNAPAPAAPVRRGQGKGFGSKDLAAMRARSMTSSQTEGVNDSKAADK